MTNFFVLHLSYIFLFYGFSFFLLAGITFLLWKQRQNLLAWGYLTAFGFTHGIAEWLDFIALDFSDPAGFRMFRSVWVAFSFFFLLEFGRKSLEKYMSLKNTARISLFFGALSLFGLFYGLNEFQTFSRYFLAFTGASISSIAFFIAAKKSADGKYSLFISGLIVAIYGMSAGLVTPKSAFYILNHDEFLALTGAPIQLIRMLCATALTIAIWEYYESAQKLVLSRKDFKRNQLFGRLTIYGTLVIISVGWITVHAHLTYLAPAHGFILSKLHVSLDRLIIFGFSLFGSIFLLLSYIFHQGRQRSIQQLYTSELKYRELVENANSIILRMDTKGNITFINEFAETFFGYSRNEILGRNVIGTIIPKIELGERDLNYLINTIATNPEQFKNNANENICRNGRRVWISWTNKPILDEKKKLLEILCVGNDITDRILAENALREKTQQLSERVSELDCLYEISKLFENEKLTIDEILSEVVALIPSAFRNPKATSARILIDRNIFATSNFKESSNYLTIPIRIRGQETSRLEVCLNEEETSKTFSEEEKLLAKVVTEHIGRVVERYKTQVELRKFVTAVERSTLTIVITNSNGEIEYVNPKFTQMTGYTFEEAKGKNPRILKSGESPAGHYTKLWKTITSGNVWSGEFHNKRKNGELFWEFASIVPIFDPAGNITHYIALKEDITARKILEKELRESRTFFQTMIENVPLAVFAKDINGHYILWNSMSEKLYGRSASQVIGHTAADVFPPEEAAKYQKSDSDVLSNQTVVETPEVITGNLDKNPRTVHSIKAPIIDQAGNVVYIIGISEDITDRKKFEQLKDEFIATVSHELRTPMTIVREGISQVLDGILGTVNNDQKSILTLCIEAVDRLGRIVNDLLDISKIESGKLELKRELIDFVALAKSVVSHFGIRAKEKNLELQLTFSQERIDVFADPDKILQVLTNLLGNAVKFTDSGSVKINMTDHKEFVQCEILDTGRGIASADLPRLFNKFEQFGRKPGAGEKGTGLGLPITKGIIELHCGKIWAESELNKGTKFLFILPKFSEAELIKDYIDRYLVRAKKANSSFSIVFFEISPAINEKLSPTVKERFFDSLAFVLKENLRNKTDLVIRISSGIMILMIGNQKKDAAALIERLDPIFKKSQLFDETIKEGELNARIINYPSDGNETGALITKLLAR